MSYSSLVVPSGSGLWRRLAASVPGDARDGLGFFFLALVLYLPGIRWGLPFATAANRIRPWGQDELGPLGPLAELYSVFIASDPSPDQFNPQYPLLQYLVQALLCGPYALWLWVSGGLTEFAREYPYGLTDPVGSLETLTVLARVPSLLMAAGVVAVACRTATLWCNRTAGRVAGLAVLLSYPMFYYARTSNVDMGALFWASLGLAVYVSCLRDGLTRRRAAWLGCFAALATATKDPTYALFATVALVLVGLQIARVRSGETSWRDAIGVLSVGASVSLCVYAVASGLIFSIDRFVEHLYFISRGSLSLTSYIAFDSNWVYVTVFLGTVRYSIEALGVPFSAAAAGGIVYCLMRDRSRLLLLLPALGFWLAAIVPTHLILFRFVILIAYVLALFAGFGAAAALRAGSSNVRRAAWIGLILTCLWGGLRWADFTYQMTHDTRNEVASWLRRNMVAGDEIGYYAAGAKLPHLDFGIVSLPLPGSRAHGELGVARQEPPEFIAVVPQQAWEGEEGAFPVEFFAGLMDGSRGYRQMLAVRTPSLFTRRIVSFVNPPVRLFVRTDVVARLVDREPRIERSDPQRSLPTR